MKHGKETERIPGFLLWQVSKLWQRHLTRVFKSLGLSHTQVILLGNIVRLHGENQPVNQTVLSRVTKVDLMTTSSVLRSLESKKLIQRIADTNDKRAQYVTPTGLGVSTTYEALQRLQQTQKIFFKGVEQDMDRLINTLQILIKTNESGGKIK